MPSAILFSFALRTAVLWAIVRVAFAAVLAGGARLVPGLPVDPQASVRFGPPTALAVVVLVVVLVLLDVRAMRERVFLANLGVGLRAVAATVFAAATLFELIVYTAFAVT